MQTKCHLSLLIHEQARKYGDAPALTFKDFGSDKWRTVSWNHFSLRVKQVSNALLNLGVKPQENIAVFSQNCLQYLYTDFGAYGVRGVTVPFYATSSEQQIHFDDFLKLGENLPRQSEVEKRWAEANDDDLCNILYTSGTTGDSKGVMLTYGQYHAALKANDECVPVGETDRVISFLPYTHIFERAWAYLALSEGAQIIINTNPHEIQDSMRQTHPTCMSSVPRFWEKVYTGVKERIEAASPLQRRLFTRALEVGRRHNIHYLSRGKQPPLRLRMEYKLLNRTVLSLVRKQLGLENANIFPTAGARVSPEVEEFVHAIGICMMVGYGLTESLATVSCDHTDKPYTIGSVGRVINGIQIKIGENNEVLLKGPTITKGYYKREALNATIFDKDGFFRTGDAGYIKNGELFLTERLKDLYKTSNGKYIAPQMIEALLLVDKYIDQVAVVADERKFVSALVVPEFRVVEEYAHAHGIEFNSREDLCANRQIHQMMLDRIHTLVQQLAPYEQIKRITLIPHHFSMESGELTNTLKLRRPVILTNYKELIDKMYEERKLAQGVEYSLYI